MRSSSLWMKMANNSTADYSSLTSSTSLPFKTFYFFFLAAFAALAAAFSAAFAALSARAAAAAFLAASSCIFFCNFLSCKWNEWVGRG